MTASGFRLIPASTRPPLRSTHASTRQRTATRLPAAAYKYSRTRRTRPTTTRGWTAAPKSACGPAHTSSHDHQQTLLRRLPRSLPSAAARATEGCNLTSSRRGLILPQHLFLTEPSRRHNLPFPDHHHKDAITIPGRDNSVRPSSRPLPADTATCRPLQPLHIAQSESLSDTGRLTTRSQRVRQLVGGLSRSHGRREVVHRWPDSDRRREVLQAGHGQTTPERRPAESGQTQHMTWEGGLLCFKSFNAWLAFRGTIR